MEQVAEILVWLVVQENPNSRPPMQLRLAKHVPRRLTTSELVVARSYRFSTRAKQLVRLVVLALATASVLVGLMFHINPVTGLPEISDAKCVCNVEYITSKWDLASI